MWVLVSLSIEAMAKMHRACAHSGCRTAPPHGCAVAAERLYMGQQGRSTRSAAMTRNYRIKTTKNRLETGFCVLIIHAKLS